MTGSGTLLDPYVIWDVNDLQLLKNHLALFAPGLFYELGCDIDASATVGWNGGAGFEPIGSEDDILTGNYRPNADHSVSNLAHWTTVPPAVPWGNWWTLVNEVVADDAASYVASNIATAWVLFSIPAITVPLNSEDIVVRPTMRIRNSSAVERNYACYMRANGIDDYCTRWLVWPPNWTLIDNDYVSNWGGIPWQAPNIPVEAIGFYTVQGFINATQVYLYVQYVLRFRHSLDGKGYTIRNLHINRPLADYIGLFGSIKDASIKNLNLEDFIITGHDDVGPLAGRCRDSAIDNVHSNNININARRRAGGLIGYAH